MRDNKMNGLVAQATATLQESGGRMTTQRRIILEALEALGAQGEHPNAEQVYEVVRRQNDATHTSTVYRTLGWLAEAGLVNAQYLDPGGGDRCEHFESTLPATHYHFVCVRCGQIVEFECPPIEQVRTQFIQQHGGSIERVSLTLHGLCEACRKTEAGC